MILYDEYIWGDKFKKYYENNKNIIFCNNRDINYVKSNVPLNSEIIITHNGDTPVECDLVYTYTSCKLWFGQNIFCKDKHVYALPIGLENDYIGGQPQRKLILNEKSFIEKTPSKLAYFNCNVNTHKPDRIPAFEYFKTKSWCTVKNPRPDYHAFCDETLDHYFVISPRGNGLDCHRSWESLYLNRYLVMKRYHGLEQLFEDLPVVFVDNWNEVTEELLQNKLIEFKNKLFNYEKLKFSYWIKFIEDKVKYL